MDAPVSVRRRPAFVRRFAPFAGALLFAVALTSALRADGIVLPLVAAPPVTMPDQRVLLVWHEKEQTETLVIESRFTGAGHDFAWVVPLPSKPEVKPATSGTLPALAAMFRPAIAEEWSFAPGLAVVLGALLAMMLVFGAEGMKTLTRAAALAIGVIGVLVVTLAAHNGLSALVLLVSVIFFLLSVLVWISSTRAWLAPIGVLLSVGIIAGTLLPTFSSVRGMSGGPAPAGVEIEHSTIGNYDVAVLSGTSADGIAQWLRDNRFALPLAAEPIVSEHTRAGGYFVAARLRRTADDTQPTAPAPLIFTFKTSQPIYPMKLTGAGATRPLDVEMFVFGDTRAVMDGMEVQACVPIEPSAAVDGQEWPRRSMDTIQLSHTALRELCAGTKIVTRLTGTFAPGQMNRDLTIRWESSKGSTGLLKYAPGDTAGRAALAAFAMLFCSAIGAAWRWGTYQAPLRPALLSILTAAVAAGAIWFSLPTVPVVRIEPSIISRRRTQELAKNWLIRVVDLKPSENTEAQVHEITQQVLKDSSFGGERSPVREGDAPNNYHLRRLPAGTWQFIWIDEYGREVIWSE